MRLVLTVILLAVALVAPRASSAQCTTWKAGPFFNGSGPIGTDGTIGAVCTWDPDGAGPLLERLVIGGSFTTVGGVAATNIAQWDPATGQWSPLGSVFIPVSTLKVFNGELYAGGGFADNNVGTFENPVRRWDGSAWVNLPPTNTGTVSVLEEYNGSLYVGGSFMTHFTVQPDGPAHYIARFDAGANLWRTVENGVGSQTNTAVRALSVYNGDLYVGGNVPGAPGTVANLAKWNPATHWTQITTGTDLGAIYDFAQFSGQLIVAGGFLTLNGVTRNNIAAWNGSSFSSYSSGTGGAGGIRCATIYNGIAIGGAFTTASGSPANRAALWPPGGSAWSALNGGLDGTVEDMVAYRGQLIAVGSFLNADGGLVNHIAHWDGATWASFGGGVGNYILAMAPYNGRMVAGGDFHQPTNSLATAHNIAGFNGNVVSNFGIGINGLVQSLESFKYPTINGSYELIAGGQFNLAGGIAANNIARWNENPIVVFPPPAWAAMGGGFNGPVYAIRRYSGITYAAGAFTNSGLNRIAKWNETTDVWEAMGTGLNGFCYAMKEYNGNLYVAGNFSTANGITARGLARWNGTSWSAVTATIFDGVLALEVYDGKLIIGGQFSAFPGNPNLIAFDGTNFTALGAGGANSNVRALRTIGSRLYVGGDFTSLGGVPVNRIGYWDGSWHDTGAGTDNIVFALGSFANELHVGGGFANVDYDGTPPSLLSPFWGRYGDGLVWFTLNPFSRTVEVGSDVTFNAQIANGFTGVTYQWFHDGLPLSNGPTPWGSTIIGAQTLNLTLLDVLGVDAGQYRLDATNACGTASIFPATLTVQRTVDATPGVSQTLFEAIGPNPARGGSQLAFSLAHDATVQVQVFDISGRMVRRMDLGRLPSGQHRASWDARGSDGQQVAPSIYVVRLAVDGRPIGSKRLAILR